MRDPILHELEAALAVNLLKALQATEQEQGQKINTHRPNATHLFAAWLPLIEHFAFQVQHLRP